MHRAMLSFLLGTSSFRLPEISLFVGLFNFIYPLDGAVSYSELPVHVNCLFLICFALSETLTFILLAFFKEAVGLTALLLSFTITASFTKFCYFLLNSEINNGFCSFLLLIFTPGVPKIGFHVNAFPLLILLLLNHFFSSLFVLSLTQPGLNFMVLLFQFLCRQNRTIAWTQSMRRLYFLINRSHERREPVLLVGDTGGGKTTICQILSNVLEQRLHILNCHQYTETSDFLGVGFLFHPIIS